MLLVESHTISESTKQNQNWFIEGIFAQADIVNGNRRIYPQKILDREINRFDENAVKRRTAVGELSHPESPSINPDRAAILIEKIEKNGSDYIGKAKVLDTPCGKIVQAMLEGGVVVGVSTRGSGSVRKNKEGISEVLDDFQLFTIDVVMNPSAPKAFMNAIFESENLIAELSENQNLAKEFKIFLAEKTKAKNIKNRLTREEKIVEAFKNLVSSLSVK